MNSVFSSKSPFYQRGFHMIKYQLYAYMVLQIFDILTELERKTEIYNTVEF